MANQPGSSGAPTPTDDVLKAVLATKDFSYLNKVKQLDKDFVLSTDEQGRQNATQVVEWLQKFYDFLPSEQGLLSEQRITLPIEDRNDLVLVTKKGNRLPDQDQDNNLYLSDIVSIISALSHRLTQLKDVAGSGSFAGFAEKIADSSIVNSWIKTDSNFNQFKNLYDKEGAFYESSLEKVYFRIREHILKLQHALLALIDTYERPPLGYLEQSVFAEFLVEAMFAPAIFAHLETIDSFKQHILANVALSNTSDPDYANPNLINARIASNRDIVRAQIVSLLKENQNATAQFVQAFFDEYTPIKYPTLLKDPPKHIWQLKDKNGKLIDYYLDEGKEKYLPDEQAYQAAIEIVAKAFYERNHEILAQNVLQPSQPVAAAPTATTQETGGDGEGYLPPDEVFDIYKLGNTFSDERLAYESAWISNQALFQLFAARGLTEAEINAIDPALYGDIRAQVLVLLHGYSAANIQRLFASASQRQRALLELENALNRDSILVDRVSKVLERLMRGTITKISLTAPTRDALREQITLAFGESALSPTLDVNVQNSIDALVWNYGLNELLPAAEREGRKDAVWFIENLDSGKLLAIFFANEALNVYNNLSQDQKNEVIAKLKALLIGYVKIRAAEMALRSQSEEVGRGLQNGGKGVSDDEAAIVTGDSTTFTNHYLGGDHPFSTLRKDFGKDGEGADRAVQMHQSRGTSLAQRFREISDAFLPAWNGLDAEDQLLIYTYFGITPPVVAPGAKLPFTLEFILLTSSKIAEIKQAARDNKLAELRAQQAEIDLINEAQQARREYEDAFVQSAAFDSAAADAAEEAPDAPEPDEEPLETQPDAGGGNTEVPGLRGARQPRNRTSPFKKLQEKFKNSKGGQAVKKAQEALKNTLKKVREKVGGKALSTIVGGLGTMLGGVGAVLGPMAELLWKNREKVLGALAFGIAKALQAFFSLPGFLGGSLLGAAGFAAGGLPGAALGLGLGTATGTSAFGALTQSNAVATGVGASSTATSAGQAATANAANAANTANASQAATAAQAAEASTLSTLLSTATAPAAIGILAPALFLIMTALSTLYIVFTIQSSFLVKTPSMLEFFSEFPPGGQPQEGCFLQGQAGFIYPNPTHPDRVTTIAWPPENWETFTQVWDKRASSNACFVKLVCGIPTPISVFRLPGSEYAGWAASALDGNGLGLYDPAFEWDLGSSEYTIVHELGHIIDYRNSGLRAEFIATTGLGQASGDCLNYPFHALCLQPGGDGEAFAQAVVLGLIWEDRPFSGTIYNFPQINPTAYNWIIKNIYSCQ